ncbi:hypothetical protein VTO73DRAFT_5070 [Trametes versicolor]
MSAGGQLELAAALVEHPIGSQGHRDTISLDPHYGALGHSSAADTPYSCALRPRGDKRPRWGAPRPSREPRACLAYARRSRAAEPTSGVEGWAERRPSGFWQPLCRASQRLLRSASAWVKEGGAPGRVVGVRVNGRWGRRWCSDESERPRHRAAASVSLSCTGPIPKLGVQLSRVSRRYPAEKKVEGREYLHATRSNVFWVLTQQKVRC